MFQTLKVLNERPKPFSRYTAEELWTDPHISARMLAFHLDADGDVASRRPALIEGIVDWIDRRLGLTDRAVCDLGCGPGLYSARMARRGAHVTGVDFSPRSIDYASELVRQESLAVDFIQGDYLKDALPKNQDLVCLIYGDICALSPDQRRQLFGKVRASLNSGGHFVLDAFSNPQYELRKEGAAYSRRLMDGFWAEGDYFGFQTTFLYDDLKLALDRYLIIEPHRTREVFNWLQYFDDSALAEELTQNGFDVVQVVDALSGEPWKISPHEFAIIASI